MITSVLRRTPPSSSTSDRSPTRLTIAGRASSVPGNCRAGARHGVGRGGRQHVARAVGEQDVSSDGPPGGDRMSTAQADAPQADAPRPEAEALNAGTKPVAESHRFDEARAGGLDGGQCRGLRGPAGGAPVQGRPVQPDLPADHARPKYVLRRKPPGQAAALGPRGRPRVQGDHAPCIRPASRWPSPMACAWTTSVIGTMFYVMDMVEGRILWDPALPDYAPAERRAIYHGHDRYAGGPAQRSTRRDRAGRFRPARQLLRAPDRPLDEAISRPPRPSPSRRWSG